MAAKTKVANNQSKVTTTTTTTTIVADKCSLWLVIITGITIVLVVIAGVCVKLLLESYISSVILVALICFEVVLGLLVLSILVWRKKKFATATSQQVVTLRKNGEYQSIHQPSAPQEETSWEYSNRATMPA